MAMPRSVTALRIRLLACLLAAAAASPAPAAATATTPGWRFVGTPVVYYSADPFREGGFVFVVLVRVNRRPPYHGSGEDRVADAYISLGGVGSGALENTTSGPPCFAGAVNDYARFPENLRHPRTGRHATVGFVLGGRRVTSALVPMRRSPSNADAEVLAFRRLGCRPEE